VFPVKYKLNFSIQVTYTSLVGTYIQREQKHGRRKRKIARECRKSFILKQMYFSANNDNSIALKHIDLQNRVGCDGFEK
jgi:hypothetical protein